MLLANVAALSAADPSCALAITIGFATPGDGGGATFRYDPSVAQSSANGATVIASSFAGAAGCWVYCGGTEIDGRVFGIGLGSGAGDETAFQLAINWLSGNVNPYGGACGTLKIPAGLPILFKSGGIVINKPINIDCRSVISYAPMTGLAVMIGSMAGWSNYYDIRFSGFTSSACGSFPSDINLNGNSAVHIGNMTFSHLTIGTTTGFSNMGVYLDGTGALGFQQVVQHNKMDLGQIADCGVGLRLLSKDAATSSAEANRIYAQNIYQCFANIIIDDATTIASTSNTFDINAMDNCSPGGVGVDMYGAFNRMYIGYTAALIKMEGSSKYNRVEIQNTESSGSAICYGGENNWVQTDAADIGQLPATGSGIVSGTVYQNNYGVPVQVTFPAVLTATATASETVAVYLSQDGSTYVQGPLAAVGASAYPTPTEFPLTFIVPPGWYWKASGSGSGKIVFGGATFTQAG